MSMLRELDTPPLRIPRRLAVIELGTNSLKLHVQPGVADPITTARVEWEVGFDIFTAKRITLPVESQILRQLHDLLVDYDLLTPRTGAEGESGEDRLQLLGVATGAFRHAENLAELFGTLAERFSLRARLLDSHEEAALLAEGFRPHVQQFPAMLCDFGAGRLEVVYCAAPDQFLHEGFEVGAIRLLQLETLDGDTPDEEIARKYLQAHLAGARVLPIQRAHATGGTLRAIAQVACSQDLTREHLRRLSDNLRRFGPPRGLTPQRRRHFRMALILLEQFFEHFGIQTLHYRSVGGGEVFVRRLASLTHPEV